ncbi:MAG TPA: trigger factor [Candidatus Saccharimonadales bacterium]|jgi:trigger factor|nr:trigger factor [Candidatus Saccharimonadales bacterium]
MNIAKKELSDIAVSLYIVADESDIKIVKSQVVNKLSQDIKIPGFRPGKAPESMVEKNIDPAKLQSEFLEVSVNDLYRQAVVLEKLRPVEQPKITINKFVPYHTLEFNAEVTVIGKIKLADYKRVKLNQQTTEITEKEIDQTVDQLLTREAKKQVVDRVSKKGDEVVVDFEGVDAKTKKLIPGTRSKKYPVTLGSNTFIPGFETHLIGCKSGQEKEFIITFPGDYSVKGLQKRRVKFSVKIIDVKSVTKPALNDKLVDKFGPFKTVEELMTDIKKELTNEKKRLVEQTRHNELVTKVVEASSVAIPEIVVDNQVDFVVQNEKQRLISQGQTWEEYLELEGITEDEFRKNIRESARQQVKTGLVLGEIALIEQVEVRPEETEVQINILKQQYNDERIRAELDKPEVKRDIADRLLVEKVILKMMSYQPPA